MRTSLIARPGVSIRRGADRHQTRIDWLHGRHSFDTGIEPSEVLIWEMHAGLGPATR